MIRTTKDSFEIAGDLHEVTAEILAITMEIYDNIADDDAKRGFAIALFNVLAMHDGELAGTLVRTADHLKQAVITEDEECLKIIRLGAEITMSYLDPECSNEEREQILAKLESLVSDDEKGNEKDDKNERSEPKIQPFNRERRNRRNGSFTS